MATLYNPATPSGTNFMSFNPVSSALTGLPNGAGTIASLTRKDNQAGGIDCCGLVNTGLTEWYHALSHVDDHLNDDDGLAGVQEPSWSDNLSWYINVVTWNAGGASLERFHHIDQDTPAGWTHANSLGNNGGNRAGPTTSAGVWRVGYFADFAGSGAIGLVACWAGIALSDAQCTELATNNRTSDWWNNTGGNPTTLIECNTLTPVDIGANPSTFSSNSGLTLAGATPTWTFDGRGVTAAGYDKHPNDFQAIPFMSNQRI